MRKTMTVIGIVALMLALLIVTGCSKEKQVTVTCAGCGMQVAKADAQMIDGKPYCSHCAEKVKQAVMHTCPDCGMKMAEKDMVLVDGTWYCPTCAAKHGYTGAGEHQHKDGQQHDHD